MANHVSLILLEDVENLGLAGKEVHVAPGYARNYLIPKGLAAKATPGTLRLLAARQEKIEQRRAEELKSAQELAAKLAELTITIAAQASDDNRLFGSVTPRSIADELAKLGVVVDHNKIKMEEAIKALGEYTVDAKLHANVIGTIKVQVVRA